jgi:hypothetical protein
MARRNSSKLTAEEAGGLYRHIAISHGLREQILTH